MPVLIAGVTFLIVAVIIGVLVFATGAPQPEKVVARRLEAIERTARRGNVSPELKVVRDELLSDVPALHNMLMQWSWAGRLRRYIDQSGMKIKPGKLILVSGILTAVGFLAVQQIFGSSLLGIPGAVLGSFIPIGFVAFKRSRRLHAFEKVFPEAIDLLGRAVRAGHSFATGLEMIATELPEPVGGEFRMVFEEQNFGLPLRDALLNLTERMPVIDVRFFVTAVLIQKETGGNLAEILDNLSHIVRERFKILGEVRIRTAQGRMTAGILISLPPIMSLVLRYINPDYIKPLFNDPWGPPLLAIAASMQVIGSIILWRIVNIEV